MKSLEEELRTSAGHLNRIVRGERWTETVDPKLADRIAKILNVEFKWLVLGEGPMRPLETATTSAVDAAVRFARQNGAREDAIQRALARNADRLAEMSAWDILRAIDTESRLLAHVPRPEVVRQTQREVRRQKAKLRASSEDANEEIPSGKPAIKGKIA